MMILNDIFVKNFFVDGRNLYACVWLDDDGRYGVQLGTVTRRYINKDRASAVYETYVKDCSLRALIHHYCDEETALFITDTFTPDYIGAFMRTLRGENVSYYEFILYNKVLSAVKENVL